MAHVPLPLLGLAAAAGAALAAAAWHGAPTGMSAAAVGSVSAADVTVVDGGTIRVLGVLGGDRIRLRGYDTPETVEPWCPAEARLGAQATVALRRMLGGARSIEFALEPGRDVDGQGWGRLTVDGRDVGEALIERELAQRHGSGRRQGWCGRSRRWRRNRRRTSRRRTAWSRGCGCRASQSGEDTGASTGSAEATTTLEGLPRTTP